MTLDKLATRLAVADRQLRVKDQCTIVAISGTRGMVRPADDGSLVAVLHMRVDALTRRQLLEAGVIVKLLGSTGIFKLQRLPNGTVERQLFCELLGIVCRRQMA